MNSPELRAYQGLKKQEAFMFKSPGFGLVVASIKQPNLMVTVPFMIPVTFTEYCH